MGETLERLRVALADRYTVTRELGAGGMATVYLAHDIKHDRDVAIKVLHPDLGAALGGERFLSEIRTTARLQHPHILPLLDSGEADGLLYYVMPLVTGETLRARLEREKQLPLDDAVLISREVADALGYAHSLGVIHRDIKPENILLQNGHALVADFGIALAVQSAGGARMTQTGLSLGTPQYMSPEQAMGERTVDARSDIYALGAVTYEMLAGDAPFTGSTVQAIVARVLTERPASLRTVRDTVTVNVEAAVLKALAKLPADRWPTAKAFAEALVNVRSTTSVDGTATIANGSRRAPRAARALMIGAAAVALVSLAIAAWSGQRNATSSNIVAVPLTLDVPNASPDLGRFAASPDGTLFAFSTNEGIALRDAGQREYHLLPGTVSGESPSFSPDGDWIVFQSNGFLRKVPVAGGSPIVVISNDSIRAGRVNWGKDGSIVFESGDRLGLISPSGTLRLLTKAERAQQPRMTDDGKGILYVNQQRGSNVMYFDIAADTAFSVLQEAAEAQLLPTGHLLYASITGGLYAVRFDQAKRKTEGSPIPVQLDVQASGGIGPFLVTRSGTLVYRAGVDAEYRIMIRDAGGKVDTLPMASKVLSYAVFSPDGKQLALTIGSARGTNRHIAIYSFARGTLTRFTVAGGGHAPIWSPDGTRLAYSREAPETDAEDIAVEPLDRSKPLLRLPRLPSDQHATAWPNETTLVFSNNSAARTMGLNRSTGSTQLVNPVTATGVRPYLDAQWGQVDVNVSPNGQWAAYTSYETGQPEVHVRHFPGTNDGGDWKISTVSGRRPHWSPDGRTIYYVTSDDKSVRAVQVTTGTSVTAGASSAVMTTDREFGSAWDVDRATGRILVTEPVSATSARIVVVQHWLDVFAQRAARPAGGAK